MADKPTLGYCIEARQNPANRNETIFVPRLVERAGSTVSLATIVENAIDRGLIAGLKPSAAQGIADALAQQMFKEFTLGHNIQFGSYFHGQLYLDGTCESLAGPLTSANKLNIRLFKGKDFKLSREDFSMQLGTDLAAPSITDIIGSGKVSGVVELDDTATIIGKNFGDNQDASTVVAQYKTTAGEDKTVEVPVTAWGPNLITVTPSLEGIDGNYGPFTLIVNVVKGDTTLSASKNATALLV